MSFPVGGAILPRMPEQEISPESIDLGAEDLSAAMRQFDGQTE